ncbi:hypothetical protein [Speluncibacter jeojiensis]|uniref:Extradiol ring-cleavage dioxygenase class III enzyme subunit B domain-containing protein n=1 Tax=Speluncibacter jeojiensis TaxID=2710754 RepID=A0A9X4LWZ1_9ACTN|nr:hypothetical protein [Corynebacteriales bacterium D3-21]
MLTAAALVSGPPLLVPELAGGAAGETTDLREATLAAARTLVELGCEWTVLGAGTPTGVRTGTFAGFGADVTVSLDAEADDLEAGDLEADDRLAEGRVADPMMPLPLLIGGWLRGQIAPRSTVRSLLVDPAADPTSCAAIGTQLRTELDARPTPQGLLVVGDGTNTIGAKAPGGPDARATEVEEDLRHALADGDGAALAALDPQLCDELGVSGRPAWQVLAAVFGATPRTCTELYTGAPFGVGYLVGTWVL